MDTNNNQPSQRCEICFGPMPCEAHANVRTLQVVSSEDMPPAAILAAAHNSDLEYVVVVGMTKDGDEYFGSSVADAAEAMYALQRGIYKLNKRIDGISDAVGDEDGRAT